MAVSKSIMRVALVRTAAAVIFMVVAVIWSTKLKVSGIISEASFDVFVCVSILAALFIAFVDRIQSLSLRELKIELAKVELARKDVEQRQQEVRQIAKSLAQITMFMAAFYRRIGSEESLALEVEWLSNKTRLLIKNAGMDAQDQADVFQFLNEVQKMDAVEEEDKDDRQDRWKAILRAVKDDINKDTKLHSNEN